MRILLLFIFIGIVLAQTSAIALHGDETSAKTISNKILDNGIWCWHQRPTAVFYNNKTYWGWVNSSGDIGISCIDHSDNTITSFTIYSALDIDDHASPSILVRNSDGKIIIFYTGHDDATMRWRISTNTEDISAWDAEKTFVSGGNVCYPQPVQLSGESNRIYLFYRLETPIWMYRKSDDAGDTFGDAVSLISLVYCAYTHPVGNGVDKIHFSVNDAEGGNGECLDILHFYYYNGAYYESDGTLIVDEDDLPITDKANVTTVYNSGGAGNYNCKNWDIALDGSGNPVIVFSELVDLDTDHRYRYAKWNGTAWNDYEICTAGGYIDGSTVKPYSGGVCLDHNNPAVVYASRQVDGEWGIYKYLTGDGGQSWISEKLPSTSYVYTKSCRPTSVRNSTGKQNVLWWSGTYTAYTNYSTDVFGYPFGR